MSATKKYEVTCICIYEEEAETAEEAKAIVEGNIPHLFHYMIAKRIKGP